jgi:hypothetical protein
MNRILSLENSCPNMMCRFPNISSPNLQMLIQTMEKKCGFSVIDASQGRALIKKTSGSNEFGTKEPFVSFYGSSESVRRLYNSLFVPWEDAVPVGRRTDFGSEVKRLFVWICGTKKAEFSWHVRTFFMPAGNKHEVYAELYSPSWAWFSKSVYASVEHFWWNRSKIENDFAFLRKHFDEEFDKSIPILDDQNHS